MQTNKDFKNLGALSFLPLLIFLGLYIGSGLIFTAMGTPDAFGKFPRHVALVIGIAVALLMNPSVKLKDKLELFCINAGNPGVMMIVLIYLMAGGFQGAAKSMGGVDAVVNLGLTFIPSALLVPGVFLISCFISTSIGTSMGTVAAMAPIAIGVAERGGLNLALTCAAVLGGAYFGDNLSFISDTTISAAQGVGCEMKDKFKMNFFIALPAAIVAAVLFGFFGNPGTIEAGSSLELLKVVPYLAVLVTALMGFHVAGVLGAGILISGVIGIGFGYVGFWDYIGAIGDGMSDMMSISVVAILISGMIGMIKAYGGIDWLIGKLTSRIRGRKGAEYGISFLAGLLSISLVNNTIAIIVTAPIAKEIGKKYRIEPRRLASLLDIFACAFLSICPHDGAMLIVTGLAGISPVEVIRYSFYSFALILAALLTIQTGFFDRRKGL